MQIIKICKSLKNRTNISSLPHLCDLRIAVLQQFGVPSPIHSSVGRKTTSLLPIQKCPFVFVFSSYLSYFCVTPLKNTKRKRSSIQFEWTTASSIIQICGYHKNRRSYFCLSVCLSVMIVPLCLLLSSFLFIAHFLRLINYLGHYFQN